LVGDVISQFHAAVNVFRSEAIATAPLEPVEALPTGLRESAGNWGTIAESKLAGAGIGAGGAIVGPGGADFAAF
jgi:hypothetical protein